MNNNVVAQLAKWFEVELAMWLVASMMKHERELEHERMEWIRIISIFSSFLHGFILHVCSLSPKMVCISLMFSQRKPAWSGALALKKNHKWVLKYILWLIIRVIRISERGRVPMSLDKRRSTAQYELTGWTSIPCLLLSMCFLVCTFFHIFFCEICFGRPLVNSNRVFHKNACFLIKLSALYWVSN